MKNINFIKITSLLLIIVATACNKEECGYDQNTSDGNIKNPPNGYMVTTNSLNAGGNAAQVFKTLYNASAPIGGDWNNPSLGTNQVQQVTTDWTFAKIGEVFGIAIDKSIGNVYLSATDVYNYDFGSGASNFGSAGGSGIYFSKVTATTASPTTTLVSTLNSNAWNYLLTNKIPNSGIGLGNSIGNLAFDKSHNQLFVSNLEDGRIYRIDATTGNVKSVFDPFTLDAPSNGMVAKGERIWGIGVLTQGGTTEVYFARTELTLNSIWSIQLDSTGEFIASPQAGQANVFNDSASSSKKVIAKIGVQDKITDIEFSGTGKMLLAERGNPHSASIFEYQKAGTTWVVANTFFVGGFTGQNSAGGVDYGSKEVSGSFISDGLVWGSQNYGIPSLNNPLYYGSTAPNPPLSYLSYGVEGINAAGNLAPTNGITDLFIKRNTVYNAKGALGDVDLF
jgi:hypothetical protein